MKQKTKIIYNIIISILALAAFLIIAFLFNNFFFALMSGLLIILIGRIINKIINRHNPKEEDKLDNYNAAVILSIADQTKFNFPNGR